MLHDYWGLTPHVRSQVRRFAEQGYYVIAPDVFNRQLASSPEEAEALARHASETALPHVMAALHALKSHHKCNGKIGLVGAGLGGQLAIQAAVAREDISALVTFYTLPDDLSALRSLDCPLLVLLAGQDPDSPPEKVETLRQVFESVGHQVVVFPDVGRDFFDDSRPAFDPTAAADAWTQALSFLNQHLDVPPVKPPPPGEFNPGRVY
jgi:carboxymethylenebutenolidase